MKQEAVSDEFQTTLDGEDCGEDIVKVCEILQIFKINVRSYFEILTLT